MFMHINIFFITILFLLFSFGFNLLFAKEFETNFGSSEFKNRIKIIKPDDVFIKNIRKVSAIITGNNQLFGEIAEDLLLIKLRDSGYDVIYKSKINEVTQQEILKRELNRKQEELELRRQLEKEGEKGRDIKILEREIEQLKRAGEVSQKEAQNIIDIGKKLGLDAIIMGTLFEGRRQIEFKEKEKNPISMEKIVVSTFFVQLIDINTEKIMLSIILEYDKGENITNAIDILTKYILDEIKKR